MPVRRVVRHERWIRPPLVQELVDEVALHQRVPLHHETGDDAAGVERLVPVAVVLEAQEVDHPALVVDAFLGEA